MIKLAKLWVFASIAFFAACSVEYGIAINNGRVDQSAH